jgi:pantothenate kinase type III
MKCKTDRPVVVVGVPDYIREASVVVMVGSAVVKILVTEREKKWFRF